MERKMSKEEAKWRKNYIRELAKKEKAAVLISAAQQETAKIFGRILTQRDRAVCHRQSLCNHRKGGKIVRSGSTLSFPIASGDSAQYAVLKHQMMHGDVWVRCLRCGKWWKPPIRSQYEFDRDFWKAMFEYEEALNFPTRNVMSGSVQLRFTQPLPNGGSRDATENVRENLKDSAGY